MGPGGGGDHALGVERRWLRQVAESLVQLVHRMLAKNRVERPSMAQVAQELDMIGSKASGMVPALPPGLISGNHKATRPGGSSPGSPTWT